MVDIYISREAEYGTKIVHVSIWGLAPTFYIVALDFLSLAGARECLQTYFCCWFRLVECIFFTYHCGSQCRARSRCIMHMHSTRRTLCADSDKKKNIINCQPAPVLCTSHL